MALNATVVTPAQVAKVDQNYPKLVAGFSSQLKCALTGPDLPDLVWLRACVLETPPVHEVIFLTDGNEFAGLVVVWLPESRIVWLVPNAQYSKGVPAVYTFACDFVKTRYGEAWGIVENPTVTDTMTGNDARFKNNGVRMQWS